MAGVVSSLTWLLLRLAERSSKAATSILQVFERPKESDNVGADTVLGVTAPVVAHIPASFGKPRKKSFVFEVSLMHDDKLAPSSNTIRGNINSQHDCDG